MSARNMTCATAFVVALAVVLPAPSARAAGGQSLSMLAGLSSTYDDNILQYSDNQLREFEAGTHPLRYSIESRDDGVFNPSLALTWDLDQGHGRRHALRLKGEGDFHSKNGTSDFRSWSVNWRESFRRERRLSLGYFALPNYYLRQLRDEDLPVGLGDFRYRRAHFDLQIATASWTQRVTRRTLAGLAYRFEGRRYNGEFRERDSGLHEGDLTFDWPHLPRHGEIALRGGYHASKADATDGDETGGVRDDDDLSYHGAVMGLDGRMEFTRNGSWRLGGDLGYELETRSYESKVATDRYHFGRSDILNAVELGLRAGYRPHWSLRGYYRLENNSASLGTSAPPTSDSGSYRVHQVGLTVEWSGGLWRRTPGVEEAPE